MADVASAAIGSTATGHYGAAGSGLTLREATIAAAWNVQGDPTQPAFVAEARRLFQLDLPTEPDTTAKSGALAALWLGPISWLLIAGGSSPLFDFMAKRDAVNAVGGALFDLSASRVAYTLSGARAPAVLATGCPLDFHPRAFAAGECRQSLYGHIGVLIDKRDETPTFTLLIPRSFARDAWHALCLTGAQYGYEVRPPAPLA
ncbi:MAG TPA: sarcosine oxidase subunit gamma family protein [Casimicrobiaceae bacterium]